MLAGQVVHDDRAQGRSDCALDPSTRIAKPQDRATLPPLSTCRTARDLRGWLLQFSRGLGFYGARYVQLGRPCWGLDESEPGYAIRYMSTSSHADQEDEQWIAGDPSRGRIRGTYIPFCWSTRSDEQLTDLQRAWLDGERARGVDAGLTIPVQDSAGCPAYISLYGFDEASVLRLIESRAPELAFLAGQFHALAKSLVPLADWVCRGPRLSNREVECLRLAALGQTVDESGRTLGISGRTVEFHLRNAFDKLGAPSKLRAVVLAFGAGGAVAI